MKALLFIPLFLCLVSPTLAHKVNIFAYVEGGIVYSESYFPDGRPVVAGKVQVFAAEEALLLEGATDSEGRFQFPQPTQPDLILQIDAGMGHRNRYLFNNSVLDR